MLHTSITHSVKATVSSKGQVVIPHALREQLGIEAGTEIIFNLHSDGTCEVKPTKFDIRDFLGMGKRLSDKPISGEEIDEAIMQAVAELDEQTKSNRENGA